MEARDDAGDLKRAALNRVAPWAKSVIVCAINYNTAHPVFDTDANRKTPEAGFHATPGLKRITTKPYCAAAKTGRR
jgi:epoxyqueuosine reductase QueG